MTYTIVQTEKGYRILKDRVIYLDGMQVRFLYDLSQNLVPDLDVVSLYFAFQKFTELLALELVSAHPHRIPSPGEKKLVQCEGTLYFGIRASVFLPKLTEEGKRVLRELMQDQLFCDLMVEMDKKMAETLLEGAS